MSSIVNQNTKSASTDDTQSIVTLPGGPQDAAESRVPDYRRRAFETRYGAELPMNDEQEVKRQDDV